MYHNICFEQTYENSQTISSENCHFYSRKKSMYVAWACFRNEVVTLYISGVTTNPVNGVSDQFRHQGCIARGLKFFGFRKKRDCTIYITKIKTLISSVCFRI